MLYLDHNATTPIAASVLEAMLPFLREVHGNPSSQHAYGQAARAAVSTARAQVARLIGADPDEIYFTSGGTESNNLAIRGVAEARPSQRHFVTSRVEHPATHAPLAWLEHHGAEVTTISVGPDCRVDPSEVTDAIHAGTALVTIMHANNETGALQPIREIAQAKGDALLHTDAAQSVGKVPIDVRDLQVDLLSLAGHKLYAPKGVGALFVRRGTAIEPLARGAGHEQGLRPGTENVPSIVGLGAACALALTDLDEAARRQDHLTQRLWDTLSQAIPDLHPTGPSTDRLPNTLNLCFPGVSGAELLSCTPQIAASTAGACHDGRETHSAVLAAMGIPASIARGAIRLSVGRTTTADEVDAAAAALITSWRTLQAR